MLFETSSGSKFLRSALLFAVVFTTSCERLSSSSSSNSGGQMPTTSAMPDASRSVDPNDCSLKHLPKFELTGSPSEISGGVLSLGTEVVVELQHNLMAAGLTQMQADVISFSANQHMTIAAGSILVDTTAGPMATIMAPTVKGAMLSLNDPCAALTDGSQRVSVANIVMQSTTGSLGSGRTTAVGLVGIKTIVESMSRTAVESLPQAGLGGTSTSTALNAVTSGTVGALSTAGLPPELVGQVAQSAASGAVSALAAAGASPTEVGGFAGAIAAAAIQGLGVAGLSPAQIIDSNAISQIVSSAASAITSAGVEAGDSASAMGSIVGAALGALSGAGMNSLELKKSALASVVDGAMQGAQEISPGDASLIGSAMTSVAQNAVLALTSAGFAASDIASATAVVVQSGISAIVSIGVSNAADAIAITASIMNGALAGAANLANSGVISAEQTQNVAQSASSSATSGLSELQNAGVVNNAADISSFTQNINSSVSDGLTRGGASSAVISNVVTQIEQASLPTPTPTPTPEPVPDAAKSTVSTNATSVIADGAASATITVTLRDAQTNPVIAKTVTLVSNRSGAMDTISAASGLSNNSGIVTFTVTSTTIGNATFTASTADNVVIAETVSVNFSVGLPTAAQSTVSTSSGSITADGATTATVTVTLRDAQARPISGKTLGLSSSRSAGTDTIGSASGPSSGSGVVTFTVQSTTIGSAIFTATDTTDNVVLAQTVTVNFTVGIPTAAQSTVSTSSASITANGTTTATITVTLRDAQNHLVSGKTVSLAASRGAGLDTISSASGPSNASGVVTFTVKSTNVGSATFTATDTTDSVVISQTAVVSYTVGLPTAAQSTVSTNSASVAADGTATSTITVTLLDAQNHPVPGKAVTLASSRTAGLDTISSASGLSNGSGVVTFTVKSTTVGSATFSAIDISDSVAITQTTAVNFSAVVGTDTNFAKVSILLHFDGANNSTVFSDVKQTSQNQLDGTPIISTTESKFGGSSGYFDSQSAVFYPSQTAYNFGSEDFTAEAWIFPTVHSSHKAVITTGQPNDGQGIWFGTLNGTPTLYAGAGGWNIALHGADQIPLNDWSHLAMTRSGDTWRLFLDGIVVDSTTVAATLTNTNNQILIGGRQNGAQYFEGYMDEVRITKGVARYTSTFSVPTQPFPDQGPTGWDAARMGEGIELTNGNLTLTKSTNVWRTVLATTGKNTGKWYFEVFIDNQPNYSHIGIARNTATLTDYAGFGADGWMFGANGSKWNNNNPTAFGGSIATGDTIGVAYDLDAGEVSIYRKASGSGVCTNLGVMFTNVTGTVYPAVSPYDVTATGHFTSASMSCSVPAGYSTLDP